MFHNHSSQLSFYDDRNTSSQYVRILSKMIFDEPCVYGMIANQQSMSLKHGISVRWGHTPPTPSFQDHINRHYLPFCKDAILLFIAVGFVPFRIRQDGPTRIPEVLPLGTFAWTVCGSDQQHAKRKRENDDPKSSKSKKSSGNGPLLVYDVTCTYCKDDIHVFNFVQPHAMLECFSPLAALIPQYNALLAVRTLALRTMEFNAKNNLVLEQQDKLLINSAADTGVSLGRMSTHLSEVNAHAC